MAKRKNKPEEAQRSMLGIHERNFMLVNMLRSQTAFDRARQLLKVDHFTIDEKWLSTIWLCANDHYNEVNELPGRDALVARFNSYYDADPEAFSDDDLEDTEDFIAMLYGFDEKNLNERVAFLWLRKFLEDRLTDNIRESLSVPTTPQDMIGRLAVWTQEASNYQALSGKRLAKPFGEGWDKKAFIDKRETGLALFDSYMDGGDAAGESYGLLGPFGGGKTTIAVMLTTRRAKLAENQWLASRKEGSRGVAFHFTYEEPVGSLRLRALSYLAKIPRKTLERVLEDQNYNLLSRADKLKSYEQRRFARDLAAGRPVLGEYERFRAAVRTLNNCWRIVDMTGADEDHPGRGGGLVEEIAAVVRQEISMAKHEGETIHPVLVLSDYVLASVEKHLDAHGLGRDELRHYINRYPLQMKHKVAIPFNCPAWSTHQLNTEAQALPPGRMPKKTDASEGRAFAENLDFLFAIGNSTREGLAAFGQLKVRRVKPEGPIIVQLDGDNAVVRDKRTDYVLNEQTGKIMRADEVRAVDSGRTDVPRDEQEESGPESRTVARQQNALRRRQRLNANRNNP